MDPVHQVAGRPSLHLEENHFSLPKGGQQAEAKPESTQLMLGAREEVQLWKLALATNEKNLDASTNLIPEPH